jgi:hypothetical protein
LRGATLLLEGRQVGQNRPPVPGALSQSALRKVMRELP